MNLHLLRRAMLIAGLSMLSSFALSACSSGGGGDDPTPISTETCEDRGDCPPDPSCEDDDSCPEDDLCAADGQCNIDCAVGADPDCSSEDGPCAGDDTEAPELRNVTINVTGSETTSSTLADTFGGSAGDDEIVVPGQASAVASISASDNATTDGNNFIVAILGADGEAVAGQSASFENSKWNVNFSIYPGDVVTAMITDEAGCTAETEFALTALTLAEAAEQGDWKRSFFTSADADTYPNAAGNNSCSLDLNSGTLSEDGADCPAGNVRDATYSIDGDMISVTEDGLTVTSSFYVDHQFFATEVFESDQSNVTSDNWTSTGGTWTRSWTTSGSSTESVSEALTFNAGTSGCPSHAAVQDCGTFTEVLTAGSSTQTITGSFTRFNPPADYGDDLGDLIVLEVEDVTGSAVSLLLAPTIGDVRTYYVTPKGNLLLQDPTIN